MPDRGLISDPTYTRLVNAPIAANNPESNGVWECADFDSAAANSRPCDTYSTAPIKRRCG